MAQQVLKNTKEKMEKAISAYTRELASIRAGRASAGVLEKITVDYYGAPTPVIQLANITVPEPRMLVIQPYDKSSLKDIEKAIQTSDLGLNPSNDGSIIRIVFPALTEERRRDLVKTVKKYAEEAKVAVRNVRRDGNDELKKLEKNGEITEDELRGHTETVQKETDKHIAKIDDITKDKEKEIMEV
ncbi:ribosome recycling factor [Ectobacillus funiculus]|jgi:ribosome recycling factor|uniref:Ribosome-recycling factor n=1 Tax=Ectobacillus funiculus TaxID=137993 RepID=A0ABV5WNU5_9BACI|nr:ribosome recycling factor [Ectobacillus funiculus]